MRFRKLSALAAGALTAGVLAGPLGGVASAADAPVEDTTIPMWCSYQTFGTTYQAAVDLTVSGTEVTASLNEIPAFGMPAMIAIKEITGSLDVVVGDEAVTLVGTDTYSPTRPGNLDLPIPELAGTLAADGTGAEVKIGDLSIDMKVNAFGRDMTATTTCDVIAETDGETPVDLWCAYQTFGTTHEAVVETRVNGASVTAEINDIPAFGMPAMIAIKEITGTLEGKINGEAVTLTGTDTYEPTRPGNLDLPIPTLTGTRAKHANDTSIAVTGLDIDMKVNAFGRDMEASTNCDVIVPVTTTTEVDLWCAYQAFGTVHSAEVEVTSNGQELTAEINDIPAFGMPAMIAIKEITGTLEAEVDGKPVTFTGTDVYETTRPGNLDLPIPTLKGERTVGFPGQENVVVKGLDIDMKVNAFGRDMEASTECDLIVETTTSLTVASAAPETVQLEATVTPNAKGSVEFTEQGEVVATAEVVDGVAKAELTGVTAGEHEYAARFVPANGASRRSEAPGATIVVEAVPAPQPVVKVAPKMQKVKVNFAKKKKVLTVGARVAGEKGAATGTVKITVKKGKKTVRTITVKLNKNGAFTKKIKKIKGKGKFKVVIQFQGDQNYKKAKATKQFRA